MWCKNMASSVICSILVALFLLVGVNGGLRYGSKPEFLHVNMDEESLGSPKWGTIEAQRENLLRQKRSTPLVPNLEDKVIEGKVSVSRNPGPYSLFYAFSGHSTFTSTHGPVTAKK